MRTVSSYVRTVSSYKETVRTRYVLSLYEEMVRTYRFFVQRNIRTVSSYKETYVPFLRTEKRYVHTVSSYKETVCTYRFERTVSWYEETVCTYRFFIQRNGTYLCPHLSQYPLVGVYDKATVNTSF